MEKYKIEKDSVQETLIIPLYGRRLCSWRFPGLYQDTTAAMLMEKVDYDFSPLERQANGLMQTSARWRSPCARMTSLGGAGLSECHPRAAVINLGCGLDNTGRACDNGRCSIWNIDLPDVIELRDRLLPAGEREKNLAFDLKDPRWMDAVRTDPEDGAVLFAAGVFYYFTTEDVKSLATGIAKRFPRGRLVFDAAGKTAVRLMLKTWVKQAGIRDVGAYFSVKDARRELEPWSPLFSVSSRGYMLGYNDLKDPSVSGFFRLLARVGDGMMNMQIVKIGFGGKK